MASITFTIADAKLAEFKLGFLEVHPNLTGTMTDNEWIKEWGLRQYYRAYRLGKQQIAEEATPPEIDESVIS